MVKNKLIVIGLILIILLIAAGSVYAGVEMKRAPTTGHLLAQPGDNWYMLCVGHWEIENNGDDSIRPVCVGD
jgi:hypothetical protein